MSTRAVRYLFIIMVMVLLLACGIADLTSQFSPTETPLPSPTPEPEGFPGWKKFEGGGVELWLPDSYEGGDLSQDLNLILEGMRELGPDFEQFAQMLEANPDAFIIYAFDFNPDSMDFVTNVNVTKEQTLSAIQIEDYMEAALSQLPPVMEAVKTETFTVNGYDAGAIELSYPINSLQIHQRLYVIKDGGDFWLVTFSTSAAEFPQRLPDFEQTISTFKIIE